MRSYLRYEEGYHIMFLPINVCGNDTRQGRTQLTYKALFRTPAQNTKVKQETRDMWIKV